MYSMAHVACKNWHPDTTSGTYLPPNTREASYAISPIAGEALGLLGCVLKRLKILMKFNSAGPVGKNEPKF